MKKSILWILIPLLILILCPAFAYAEDGSDTADASARKAELTDYADLSGKTVSMLTGAPFEELVKSKAPDVAEFTTYNATPDMLLALKSYKTDAVLINNAIAALAVNRDPALAHFPKNLQDGSFGIAFAKNDPRRDIWQEAYDSFFPLIAITVIYFILEALLAWGVGRINVTIDPRKRKREQVLKGIITESQA